jgi:hypothetical protein
VVRTAAAVVAAAVEVQPDKVEKEILLPQFPHKVPMVVSE